MLSVIFKPLLWTGCIIFSLFSCLDLLPVDLWIFGSLDPYQSMETSKSKHQADSNTSTNGKYKFLVTNISLNLNLKKSYPYFSTFSTVFSNEFKIKSETEYMEKYCRFLLIVKQRIKSFKKQWVDACKKIHNTPRPNNNQKSTFVTTEHTPPVVVKTTNHKMYARIM